jgi:hypothetical protein
VSPALDVRSENAAHRIAIEWDRTDGPVTGVCIPRPGHVVPVGLGSELASVVASSPFVAGNAIEALMLWPARTSIAGAWLHT